MDEHIPESISPDWWKSEGGFFGKLYAEADNSLEGFLQAPRTMDQRLQDEVKGVIRLCSLANGARVLDCPCGYGRHSLGLAQSGMAVTGVDVNDEHLELARRAKSQRPASNVEFVQNDMRKLGYANEFDAVINMFYSFGFFEDEADDLLSVKNFCNALKPGGKFLMHTFITVPKIHAGDYKKHDIRTLTTGNKLELYRDFNETTRREVGKWTIVKPDGSREDLAPYSMRIYTAQEFKDLCLAAGFSHFEAFGDWNGTPYQDTSELLITVATK